MWPVGFRRFASVTLIPGTALALLPKARAGCSNAARPDPWRGLWATTIPTPTKFKYRAHRLPCDSVRIQLGLSAAKILRQLDKMTVGITYVSRPLSPKAICRRNRLRGAIRKRLGKC